MRAENLERAVAEAIERSRPVAADLRREINGLVDGLMQGIGHELSGESATTARSASEASSPPGPDALRAYAHDVVRAVVRELEELTRRRLGDELGTFNLVLFGRTGTGKSSLTEALTQGFGESISPDGASDWTTDVNPGQWRGCRVVDTPGTNGWGRTKASSELEETAREALVSADVVILCFDSQSQQDGEFAKVADWIADYGKPVVAVLNNRSSMWRFPTRVPQQEIRRRLSRSVAGHAENIRDELARIGLHDVPVVALNTKRAVFARAALPYQGPDSDSLSKHRAEAGSTDVLLDWSNLPALESLLAAALGRNAVGLRLGALVSQIGGACRNADDTLRVHVEEPALRLAEQTEIGIERMLTILGAPESAFNPDPATDESGTAGMEAESSAAVGRPERNPRRDDGGLRAALAELERMRGGRFEAPPTGEFERYADHAIRAALAPLRDAAQRRADDVVDRAMAHNEVVPDNVFAERVFDTAEIEDALQGALKASAAYLRRRVGLVVEDTAADLAAVAAERARVEGRAGRLLRGMSIAAGVGGAAAGIGSAAMAALVAANIWNPVGWTVGGILLAGAAAGLIGRAFSGWSRRRARRRQEEALARARADARKAVAATFERARTAAAERAGDLVRQAFAERVGAAVQQGVELRRVAESAAHRRKLLRTTARVLPDPADPSALLRETTLACEAATGLAGNAAAAHLWLGESWCAEKPGAGEVTSLPPKPAQSIAQPGFLEWTRGAAEGPFVVPVPGSGRRWLRDTRRRLRERTAAGSAGRAQAAEDTEAAEAAAAVDAGVDEVLAQLGRLAADARPRILVCGDYNTGKSSFIRRQLVDTETDPDELPAVAAVPQTAEPTSYEIDGVVFVDNPGFQSGRKAHRAAAHSAVPDAAAVLYLFPPNLVVGKRDDLDLVLDGDPERHLQGKLDRTVLIINRSDQIGPDPFDAPGEFALRCARKRMELAQALDRTAPPGSGRPPVDPDRVVCVSADPYGFQGSRREHFDPHRHWDGMDVLAEALEELRPSLDTNGVDVSVLHGGLARFGAVLRNAAAEERVARERADQLERLRADVVDRLREGLAIRQVRAARLTDLVVEFLDRGLGRALRNSNPEERTALAERLDRWTEDPDLQAVVEQWWAESADEITVWRRRTAHSFRRRLGSKAFARTFPETGAVEGLRFLNGHPRRERRRKAARGFGRVGALIGKAADGPVIGRVATWLGRSLEPATLTRGAVVMARAGMVLQVAGSVVDVYSLVRNVQEDQELAQGRLAVSMALRECGARWAEVITDGTEDEPGLLSGLDDDCEELSARVKEIDERAAVYTRTTDALLDRIGTIREVITDALAHLGHEPVGHSARQHTEGER
ncbi:GTPase [Streptomyces sp. NPDC058613]|uniref:GTPase n=1 Tax=Streptomyces sp. NPDC058613 TaxID=3346556 RepID=UPI00364E9E22